MSRNNHSNYNLSSLVREVVFGMEDGMVSTLGAISGIAVGTSDRYIVLLSGIVIIAVESISMGVGSYLSNRTSKEVDEYAVKEEKEDIGDDIDDQESNKLSKLFMRDGWPEKISSEMAKITKSNKKLFLREMQYRELGIFPYVRKNPLKNAVFMYFAYGLGGLIPLSSYFFLPISSAISWSVVITLICLFALGAATTKFTKASPVRSGLRIFLLGGIALLVGVLIGEIASKLGV